MRRDIAVHIHGIRHDAAACVVLPVVVENSNIACLVLGEYGFGR